MSLKNFYKFINSKKINVGIIGLGYVGLPLAILFAKKGYQVFGFDSNLKRIDQLKKSQSYINRIRNTDIKILKKKGKFYSDFNKISLCDVILICVPTPLKTNNIPDLSFINKAIFSIKKYLRENQILILESTSYPGTTRELLFNKLSNKFEVGKNFFIGFSSERINPGFNENYIDKIPKVVAGYSKNCLNLISKFYSLCFKQVIKSESLEIAEFSKLLENIYRSVNIGFINEMKLVADKMKLDIFEIIKLAKTKPFGFRAFNPGPGVGGHCIPIDPHYLYWKGKKHGIKANFVKLSSDTNKKIIKFITYKVLKFLKIHNIKKNKAKILILGVAYKPNVDDYRESGSILLIKKLISKNITKIKWSDIYIKKIPPIEGFNYNKRIEINKKNLKSFDLVILMTDHNQYNYNIIYENSKFIIDCRGRYKIDNKVIRG